MKINPLDDRVVVRPHEAEQTTAGGIVLPDAAREKQQRGTVIAVGPGRRAERKRHGRGRHAVLGEVLVEHRTEERVGLTDDLHATVLGHAIGVAHARRKGTVP